MSVLRIHLCKKRKSQNGGTMVEHCSCRRGDSVHKRNEHCWGVHTRHFSHTEELSHSRAKWSRFSWTFTSVGLILLSLPYFFWFRVLIHGQNNLVTTSYRHYNGYYRSQEVSLVKIIIDGFFPMECICLIKIDIKVQRSTHLWLSLVYVHMFFIFSCEYIYTKNKLNCGSCFIYFNW